MSSYSYRAVTTEELHSALKDVADIVKHNNQTREVGICTMLHGVLNPNPKKTGVIIASEDDLHILFAKWPKFSGRLNFPVPVPASHAANPGVYYLSTPNKWIGEYGKSRKELLNWLIEQTK